MNIIHTSSSVWGGLYVQWGIDEMGFGTFSYYEKDGIMHSMNECCSHETVAAVFEQALLDMTFSDFEEMIYDEKGIGKEELLALFVTAPGRCQILYNPHDLSISEHVINFSLLHGQQEIIFTFDKHSFPDISQEDTRDFTISDLLGAGQWDSFISARQKVWYRKEKTPCETMVQNDNASCGEAYAPLHKEPHLESNGLQEEDREDIGYAHMRAANGGLIIEWSGARNRGEFFITSDFLGCKIATEGRGRAFVARVAQKMMRSLVLDEN